MGRHYGELTADNKHDLYSKYDGLHHRELCDDPVLA